MSREKEQEPYNTVGGMMELAKRATLGWPTIVHTRVSLMNGDNIDYWQMTGVGA